MGNTACLPFKSISYWFILGLFQHEFSKAELQDLPNLSWDRSPGNIPDQYYLTLLFFISENTAECGYISYTCAAYRGPGAIR